MTYKYLEKFLSINVVSYNHFLEDTKSIAARRNFGITLNKSELNNIFQKVAFILFKRWFIGKQLSKLTKSGMQVSRVIAIYPTPDSPFAFIDLGFEAEKYGNVNIIPKMDNTLKGITKRILFYINRRHPSIDSFVFIIGKDNAFEDVNNLLKTSSLQTRSDLLCISTSNPVFLSFTNSNTPDFVIHRAEEKEYHTRKLLYSLMKPLMAEPVNHTIRNNTAYLIERGLPGRPWFQINNEKALTFLKIRQRAISTLRSFQRQVKKEKSWATSLSLNDTFSEQLTKTLQVQNFNKKLQMRLNDFKKTVPNDKQVSSYFQHGDFCINNLIWDVDNTFIIDFEEFGDTSMPLHDEFSLAISFFQHRNNLDLRDLAEDIQYCLKDTQDSWKAFHSPLFTYHLLYRLGEWGQNPLREAFCKSLLQILEQHLEEPNLLF